MEEDIVNHNKYLSFAGICPLFSLLSLLDCTTQLNFNKGRFNYVASCDFPVASFLLIICYFYPHVASWQWHEWKKGNNNGLLC